MNLDTSDRTHPVLSMPNLPNPTLDRTRKLAALARYTTLFLLIALFVATHYPAHGLPRGVFRADKALHCLAYMTLTLSVLTSLDLTIGMLRPQHYFAVWLAGTLYGAFDEVTQIPVGRSCDPLDWFCDILGIVMGLTIFRLLRPLFYRLVNVKVAVN